MATNAELDHKYQELPSGFQDFGADHGDTGEFEDPSVSNLERGGTTQLLLPVGFECALESEALLLKMKQSEWEASIFTGGVSVVGTCDVCMKTLAADSSGDWMHTAGVHDLCRKHWEELDQRSQLAFSVINVQEDIPVIHRVPYVSAETEDGVITMSAGECVKRLELAAKLTKKQQETMVEHFYAADWYFTTLEHQLHLLQACTSSLMRTMTKWLAIEMAGMLAAFGFGLWMPDPGTTMVRAGLILFMANRNLAVMRMDTICNEYELHHGPQGEDLSENWLYNAQKKAFTCSMDLRLNFLLALSGYSESVSLVAALPTQRKVWNDQAQASWRASVSDTVLRFLADVELPNILAFATFGIAAVQCFWYARLMWVVHKRLKLLDRCWGACDGGNQNPVAALTNLIWQDLSAAARFGNLTIIARFASSVQQSTFDTLYGLPLGKDHDNAGSEAFATPDEWLDLGIATEHYECKGYHNAGRDVILTQVLFTSMRLSVMTSILSHTYDEQVKDSESLHMLVVPMGLAVVNMSSTMSKLFQMSRGGCQCLSYAWPTSKRRNLYYFMACLAALAYSLVRLFGVITCPSHIFQLTSLSCHDKDK